MSETTDWKAAASARTGVMSLKTIPGDGKSGMSRMRLIEEWGTGQVYCAPRQAGPTYGYRRFFLGGRGVPALEIGRRESNEPPATLRGAALGTSGSSLVGRVGLVGSS